MSGNIIIYKLFANKSHQLMRNAPSFAIMTVNYKPEIPRINPFN